MIKRAILTPVKPENFSAASNPTASISEINPRETFDPVISQLHKMAIGKYFWFIANTVKGETEQAGGLVEDIIGVPLKDFEHQPPVKLFAQSHPEDLPQMFAFTNYWIGFVNKLSRDEKLLVHPTIYMRLKNKEGLYKWTMVQYIDHVLDAHDNILYGLTVVTDISHVKTEGPAMMSILNMQDENCLHFFCSNDNGQVITQGELPKLSTREIEVLQYISIGNSSKQIAEELSLSIKTVDNHRQSMLKKTNTKSTAELISFAIRNGFL